MVIEACFGASKAAYAKASSRLALRFHESCFLFKTLATFGNQLALSFNEMYCSLSRITFEIRRFMDVFGIKVNVTVG